MNTLFPFKLITFMLLTLLVAGVVSAIAATNTIPRTRADTESGYIGSNQLKPSACSGLLLANTITGSGSILGTAGNDLILGSSAADTIDGGGGDDCILAGGGDDSIMGGDGTDICLGGGGNDTFLGCEGESQ